MAAVTDIYRYPVKSMGGHPMSSAELGMNGIPGDRCWALRDADRGGFKVGKRHAEVMGMSAELAAEPTPSEPSPEAAITFADGTRTGTADPAVNDLLSAALGTRVELCPIAPADDLAHYRRPPPDPDADLEAGLREVFARTESEPLPDLRQFPRELFEYESPPGTYFDAYPLLVMTRQALAAMAAHDPERNFDVRRFRPNIVLDAEDSGFVENAWAGRSARLGAVKIEFAMPCPRCVMTTHGFAELPRDPGVMRALVQANDGNLGIYARVAEPGRIRIGDELVLA